MVGRLQRARLTVPEAALYERAAPPGKQSCRHGVRGLSSVSPHLQGRAAKPAGLRKVNLGRKLCSSEVTVARKLHCSRWRNTGMECRNQAAEKGGVSLERPGHLCPTDSLWAPQRRSNRTSPDAGAATAPRVNCIRAQ
ncbi:hypothetical protein P4O66_006708 [Electrophorus voltai]|uniref:Uncharacterized protein n=1 Tax=Electrophorus voltai TaxID=2609070 RepID=A0AAD8ZHR1_9TELE|nr:hypothetical protein P4O66_006708 [Electrophorus voltai]